MKAKLHGISVECPKCGRVMGYEIGADDDVTYLRCMCHPTRYELPTIDLVPAADDTQDSLQGAYPI